VLLLVWSTDADIVVTRGRLAAAAVDGVLGLRSRAAFEHVPADAIYTRFRYGLAGDERDRLWGEFFDGDPDESTVCDGSSPLIRIDALLDRTPSVSPTLLGVVVVTLVIVALVVAGAVSGPFAVLSPDGSPSSVVDSQATEATAVPVDVRTPEPAPPETPRVGVPAVCPAPSADAHPAAIRPGVVDTASTSGLEGWVIEFEWNLTDFDPNDESNRVSPEVRHLAVYEAPSGRQYRLVIDRWESAERAANRTTEVGKRSERAPLVWGPYSIVVEPYATDAPGRIAADVRALFENVQTPGGLTLGDRCVDALAGRDL